MAEVVAGAFLSSLFQSLFERIDALHLIHFFMGEKLDHTLLDKLKITMITVNGLLDHAEEKQIVVPAVKQWLDELKHVAYKADDLLDEIAYALRSKLEVGSASSKSKQKVRNFFSSYSPRKSVNKLKLSVNAKLQEILDLFEHLMKQMKALGLSMRKGIGKRPSSHKTVTTSFPDDESGIYGRSEEKENIIIKLLQSDDIGVDMICIVGMGGIGKTTLAQLVYNDNRLKEWFDVKVWVHVSEEFDDSKILKDIIREITVAVENYNVETLGREKLGFELKKKLEGKRFLVVMDDVWNDNYADWGILRNSLQTVVPGCKIVITTRMESISSVMHKQGKLYHLKELSNRDCWFLFAKHAFDDGVSNIHPDLETIGRKIVKKCRGLPLAAKTVGGLLRLRRDVDEWEKVLNNDMWDLVTDNILPPLKLSYHYLPSHLKRCFAYCALFPKGYKFFKEELILLWMAEGFLMQSRGSNKEMEHLGNEYFSDLVSRSFFQQSIGDMYFVMHDLIHDLANFVSGEFCLRSLSSIIPSRTRHLSHIGAYVDLKGIDADLPLRSFLSLRPDYYSHVSEDTSSLLLLKRLRVLSLSSCDFPTDLPDSIGKLKHLRYLNLTRASIIKLPESVGCLYNLQTLILFQCRNLIELPINIARLINLCVLDIRETKLQKMPSEIGNLIELRKLTNFVLGTGKQGGSGIEQLQNLDHLKGELSIENLQNVNGLAEASTSCLKRKKHLKKLIFKWAGESDSELANGILERLMPHENLEGLCIVGYGGTQYPNWISIACSNLVSLKLNDSKNCSCLPSLGELPCLRDLSITAFEKVTDVDHRFYARSKTLIPFKSLQTLRFERMLQWELWRDHEPGAFPHLQQLYIKDCPNLTGSLPSTHSPSLTTMEIQGCHQLLVSLPTASTFCKMRLNDDFRNVVLKKLSSGLFSLQVHKYSLDPRKQVEVLSTALEEIHFSNTILDCLPLESFPNLKKLQIMDNSHVKSFSAIEEASSSSSISIIKHSFIEHVRISDSSELSVVSLLMIPTIQTFKLSSGESNMELSTFPSGLHSLQVEFDTFNLFDRVERKKLSSFFTTLETIKMTNCSTLKNFWLEFFPNLKYLKMDCCLDLESLWAPEATFLENKGQADSSPYLCSNVSHLQELCIYYCHKLHLLSLPISSAIHTMSLMDNCRVVRLRKQASGFYSLHVCRFHSLEEDIETWLISGGFLNSVAEITINCCDPLKCLQLGKFPKLRNLEVGHSPNFQFLETADEQEFPLLNILSINNCSSFASFSREGLRAPNLTTLRLLDCTALNSLPVDMHSFLPSLVNLIISRCPQVESFPRGGFPSTLRCLRIMRLENLRFIEYEVLKHLKELCIIRCPNLQYMPECMQAILPSLDELVMHDCPQLESFLNGGLPLKLRSLDITNCDKLLVGLIQCDLQALSSLARLIIVGNCEAESFPRLPSSLTFLRIQGLQKMKSLQTQHLCALTSLEVYNCPELKSLLEEGLPTSITTLVVKD